MRAEFGKRQSEVNMFEAMKSELEATMAAHNVPFASFGVTDAQSTRLHNHIGSAGDHPLGAAHIFRIASMTKPRMSTARWPR